MHLQYYNSKNDTIYTWRELHAIGIGTDSDSYLASMNIYPLQYTTPETIADSIYMDLIKDGPITVSENIAIQPFKYTFKPIEEIRTIKIHQLKERFIWSKDNGALLSEVGFWVDATKDSKQDVDGLIQETDVDPTITHVDFRGYHNDFQKITVEQLKSIQYELIKFGKQLYANKWMLEQQILVEENIQTIIDLKLSLFESPDES